MSIADFADMFPATVGHKQRTGEDRFGKPTYGSTTNYAARVRYRTAWIKGREGQNVLSRGSVWILGTPAIDPLDQIVMPDSSEVKILEVDRPQDDEGIHHTKIIFG